MATSVESSPVGGTTGLRGSILIPVGGNVFRFLETNLAFSFQNSESTPTGSYAETVNQPGQDGRFGDYFEISPAGFV